MNLTQAPVWLSGLILAVILPMAAEAGYWLHRRIARTPSDVDASNGAGHVVSAALALLGLLIGFTFAMAADRYETRRLLVVEEANAISSAYQLYQLLDDPARGQLSALMLGYMHVRQTFAAADTDETRLNLVDTSSGAIADRIQTQTAVALRAQSDARFSAPILNANNAVFDLAATRRAAIDARVPQGVFTVMIIFAFTTALIMGYGLSAGRQRHRVASTGLFVLVAMAISLIMDLDDPGSGGIRVSQAPLDRAAAVIAIDMARPHPGHTGSAAEPSANPVP